MDQLPLLPAAIAERMIELSRREGFWRGALVGFAAGAVVVGALVVLALVPL